MAGEHTLSTSPHNRVRDPKRDPMRALAQGLVLAAAAGLGACALDAALARLTLGHGLPLAWRDPAVYAGVALALGLVLALLPALRRSPGRLGAAAFAALYALPVAERLEHAATPIAGATAGVVAALVGVAGMGVFVFVLRRLADRWTVACLLLGVVTALGLAVNRDLVARPLEPAALAADAALLAAALLLAWAAGRSAPDGRLSDARATVARAAGLALVLGVFVALLRPAPQESSTVVAGPDRPHLILVLVDTLRADVFERVLAETPEGQALAERLAPAASFDQAIAAAPWTAPSVGSILTGLYPREHGFGSSADDPSRPLRSLSPTVPTLASRLRNRGYRTEAIVTNPLLHPVSGIARGFEHYEILGGATTKMPLLAVLAERLHLFADEPYQPADRVRARLLSRLDALAASKRPLFLWLHLMDPHLPLHEHPELEPTSFELPSFELPSFEPEHASAEAGPAMENGAEEARLYVGEVRSAAAEIVTMIDALDDAGLWRDSLFVLVSDHGEMLVGDARRTGVVDPATGIEKVTGHGHALYDELVRVPLVIRPPGGLDAPRRVQVLVSHVDLHDTLVEMLGVDVPAIGRDRVSVAGWVHGARGERRRQALLDGVQVGPPQRGLRTRAAKLVLHARSGRLQLFDLLRDPGERADRVDDDPRTRKVMRRRLDEALDALDAGPETAPLEVDAETRRRLEALGYVQ